MMLIKWQQWMEWDEQRAEKRYNMFPFVHSFRWPLHQPYLNSWEDVWKEASPYSLVLESGKEGRYTYLGLHPASLIEGKNDQAEAYELYRAGDGQYSKQLKHAWKEQPLQAIERWMSIYRAPSLPTGQFPKWKGGCAGFLSYDVARSIEQLPDLANDDLAIPDYLFMQFNEIWVIDHEEQQVFCIIHQPIAPETDRQQLEQYYTEAMDRAQQMEIFWEKLLGETKQVDVREQLYKERFTFSEQHSIDIDADTMSGNTSPFAKQAYMDAVTAIQSYIAAGDVFQVNLSLRQSRDVSITAEELYEWLKIINPSPYMGLLRTPQFQIVSGSPELLVQLVDNKLVARPIAGTRKRGIDAADDQRLADELQNDSKEKAEHVMLVDLERNDLGRIAAYGSVEVKELMVIERYSHVMHLVSQVEAQLHHDYSLYDVIAAKFPGGTITGAPKVRTMEIIEELEPVRRGPYTGSMGFIDYSGDMELNIIIRTIVLDGGKAHIQAGAGIVIDSDPESEYYESLNKAKALWRTIQLSERFASNKNQGGNDR
ncbi:anthranilate synthase component I family protein [Paenibacillus yanchengensis]|uniref:Anthranilate synthase component I family protein n=1 Tax=Paenibacillus yanchengensis TaxID=2035833 RepID=A0ABW4YI61_9BACL